MEKPRRLVVVTGFGPFGEHSVNASWIAVQELEKLGLGDDVDLHVCEIPVEYQAVERLIPALWKKHSPQVTGGPRGPVWHGHHGDAGKVRPQHRLPRPGQLPLLPGLPVLHRGGARVHRLRHRHGRRLQEGLHPGAGRGRDDIEGCRQVGGADSRLATEGSPPGSVVPLRLHLLHLAVPQPRPLGLRPRSPAGEALQRRSAGASPAGHHRSDAQRLETLRQQHQLPQRALRHEPRVPPAPSLLHFWKRNFSHSTLGAGGRAFLPDFEPQGPLCIR
uniref:pyroglutamyl-peptidase 1 isoform X1 n=1 Tax=Podarcis muralis TaxID=64176 RepID=UPI00109F1241|nr:pyroglutamyl-peptidase 1 isoform X1 [Podarcis muralis]